MNLKIGASSLGLALLAACQSLAAPAAQREPALLENPGEAVTAELSAAIVRLGGFSSMLLGPKAFTASDVLVVERRHQFSADGTLIQGMDLERPQRFFLRRDADGHCWLEHEKSGREALLTEARCKPR